MSRVLFLFSIVLAALLALLISGMNSSRVEVELAFVRIATPLGLALITAFVCGLLAGLFWRVSWVTRLLSERGQLRRALRAAEMRARQAAAGDNAR
jgi:uncharacterized integral membrane protein